MNTGNASKCAVHIADNGDGTFTNPVMPNAHWSDPCLLKVGRDYYYVSSTAEHCPLVQVVHSRDLVNWDVIGSMTRFWPQGRSEAMNWSPRICYTNNKFRITGHNGEDGFYIYESDKPEGPYEPIKHQFTEMNGQWAPNIFEDEDGTKYMIASHWIQKVDDMALSFTEERIRVAKGIMPENPSLFKHEGYYYWIESLNGTDTPGNTEASSKISIWRSPNVTGPYEMREQALVKGNNRFQMANTGTAIQGPDGNWWYAYNTWDMTKFTMCRQMHLDRLEWVDGWPVINDNKGPALSYPKPIDTETPRWIPDLNDDFDSQKLEGITQGTLGRKWLFKREQPDAWSLSENPGWLRLKTLQPGIEAVDVANYVGQRPVGSYYTISTQMKMRITSPFQQAGLSIREYTSACGIAIGLQPMQVCEEPRFMLKVWHNNKDHYDEIFVVDDVSNGPVSENGIFLKIEQNGLVANTFYSLDGTTWIQAGKPYSYTFAQGYWRRRYFSTFYPGLFAGQYTYSPNPGYADFKYFHYEGFDR